MQNHAADHLHVVMPHAQIPAARLAAGGKRLDQQVVQRFAGGQPLAEFDGLLPQLSSVMAWNLGSRALMASTFGCNFLMYRAFDEPNSDVIARSMAMANAAEKAGDQFPNSFQDFHERHRIGSRNCRGRRCRESRHVRRKGCKRRKIF